MKRYLVTILLLIASPTWGVDPRQYYQWPDTVSLPDNSRMLLYDPALGSLNITGAALKTAVATPAPDLSGYARLRQKATFTNVSTPLAYVSDRLYANTLQMSNTLFMTGNNILGAYTVQANNLLSGGNSASVSSLVTHLSNTSNPHATTAAQLGLAAVATSGSWTDILLKPTIPQVCVDIYDGKPATVAVGATTTGAPGDSASVTNSGTSADAVFNFTIPRGFRGYSGSSGTVAVGTVTTGAAGTSAIVTNSGTASAAILNFTIPKGQDADLSGLTQSLVETKLAEPGGKILKRPVAANTETLIEIVRFAGSTSLYISASGLLVVQDTNGYRRWAFDPATWTMAMKDANNKTRMLFASTGEMTQYRGDGTTKGFQLYSAGRGVF